MPLQLPAARDHVGAACCVAGGVGVWPGEYKFAGGAVDGNETPLECATREFEEEMLRPCGITMPASAVFRPFCVKQTRPIRGRSDLMFNYVLVASENPWLSTVSTANVNAGLAERRARHAELVETGEFWAMGNKAKELVSPEVRSVRWVNLRDAVQFTLSSMSRKVIHINEWQRDAFAAHGVKRRDPMFITGATLFELEGFPTERSLLDHAAQADMDALAKAEQWVHTGMTQADLESAFAERVANPHKVNPSFKVQSQITELKRQRAVDHKATGAKL